MMPSKIPLIPAMRPVNSMSSTAESPISTPPIAAETGVKLAMTLPRDPLPRFSVRYRIHRLLSHHGPVRLFPSVDAALDVAGGFKACVLRGLHRHPRAFA